MKHWTEKLVELKACPDAVKWATAYPTLEAAWAACDRGDWMLWLAGSVSGAPGSEPRRTVARAAAACARLALPAWKERHPEDTTVEAAILAAERGDPKECRKAASAAWAEAWAAASAAWAAASAAWEEAAEAASASAWAAAAAAWAAAASASAARIKCLSECADLVRGFYPVPPALVSAA